MGRPPVYCRMLRQALFGGVRRCPALVGEIDTLESARKRESAPKSAKHQPPAGCRRLFQAPCSGLRRCPA
eukprot:12955133-Alexandrium_andersonii.AAC.1